MQSLPANAGNDCMITLMGVDCSASVHFPAIM